VGVLYNDTSTRRTFYISRIIDEEMKKGDLFVITGMSGAELAIRVLDIPDDDIIMPSYNTAKSQEYWTGWILAYYQWENGKTFEMIDKEIPICKIRNMYNPYHEMDISSAILKLREMSQVSRAETYLKKLRKRAGISQSILAEETGIPVKTIQQYEQRRKDINKAQVEYVVRLSKALCCEPQDILEEK
jgi:DNA-binding transcriptional regulator YiaG